MPTQFDELPPGVPAHAMGAMTPPAPSPTPGLFQRFLDAMGTPSKTMTSGPPWDTHNVPNPEYKSWQDRQNNAISTPITTGHPWLDKVINLFHPSVQIEHPLAHTNNLVNRADQLESQLNDLQQRSGK